MQQGGSNERYYIQFQVWRPTGVNICYTLVGFNAPPLGAGGAVNVSLLLVPSAACVLLAVAENEQIEFHTGDVIGYYADRYGSNRKGGGIQWIAHSNVVVYYTVNVPLSDLKTEYIISPLVPDPTACGFNIEGSTSISHHLSVELRSLP